LENRVGEFTQHKANAVTEAAPCDANKRQGLVGGQDGLGGLVTVLPQVNVPEVSAAATVNGHVVKGNEIFPHPESRGKTQREKPNGKTQ
jgi:hypothetical protein